MKTFLFATLFTLAACGSSKPAATTAPSEPAAPAEPTPAEPAAPAEAPVAEVPAAPPTPPPDPKVALLEAEQAAYQTARPVFDKWCAKCHSYGGEKRSKKKIEELDISAYPFRGEHASAKDIREVLAIGGGKPSMPADKKGAVKGDELAAIAAWADAWDKAEEAGAHAAATDAK